MRVFLPLVSGVMCTVHVQFAVSPHSWVAPIYEVNVFAAVLFCVDNYVGLIPHILAWIYQPFIFGNPNLV